MVEIIAHHTGQSIDQIWADIDRDRFMIPDEAQGYGVIDGVIASARALD
jgi:ATP-dependent Clp protease protease subunit